MEKLIQSFHGLQQDMQAWALVALGLLLPVCIVLALVALRWIRHGRLAAKTSHRFFAQQGEIARWFKSW